MRVCRAQIGELGSLVALRKRPLVFRHSSAVSGFRIAHLAHSRVSTAAFDGRHIHAYFEDSLERVRISFGDRVRRFLDASSDDRHFGLVGEHEGLRADVVVER